MSAKKSNSISTVKVKNINSLLLKKKFVKKVNLDSVFLQTDNFFPFKKPYVNLLQISNALELKTDLYCLLKKLKIQKRFFLVSDQSSKTLDKYCLNLQTSKLFSSQIELLKKKEGKNINLSFLVYKNKLKNFNNINYSNLSNLKTEDFHFILKGYKVYNKHFKYLKVEKQNLFLDILKKKRFVKKLFEGRFFLNSTKKKKKYRMLYNFYEKNKIKIRYFLNIYKLSHLKYVNLKKSSYKLLKNLIWRRKKRNKWRKTSLFRFFRSRHRLLYKFYVPKHLEINFKTFNFISCRDLDLSTLNSKIPFWLNLRRLLTFLSA